MHWFVHTLAAALSLAGAAAGYCAPYTPAHDSAVLFRKPAPAGWLPEAVRVQRTALVGAADNLDLALPLARHYLALGSEQGDARYYGRAQSVLEPWWEQASPPADVLLLRAQINQHHHHFDAALDDLGVLLQQQPSHAQAWLTQAVILQVRGEYKKAIASCMPLLRLASSLVVSTCTGSVAGLNGRAREGYKLVSTALADAPLADPVEHLWALTVRAEIAARLGWQERAEEHFQQALALNARDRYLLLAYSDYLLYQGRATDVVNLLAQRELSDSLLLRRVLAWQHLHAPRFARERNTLLARLEAAEQRGEQTHLGTRARAALFLQREPGRGLELALRNWVLQREPADARLVLEAALRSGQPDSAAPVLAWLARTGLEDIQINALAKRVRGATG